MYGFYRVAAAVPKLRVADVTYNVEQILKLIRQAHKEGAAVIVFPELCVTGYTCGDLFHQSTLIDSVSTAISTLCAKTKKLDLAIVLGVPLLSNSHLYNCGLVLQNGELKGAVPKTYLPNYKEFYEKRWFSSGRGLTSSFLRFNDFNVEFGTNLLFSADRYFRFGIELCEDLWAVIPPSSHHALAGATVIVNPSASNELVGKADYRRGLVLNQSARCVAAYVYASAGVMESTTDNVYGGHSIIAENGARVSENDRFQRDNQIIYADVDCQRLAMLRMSETSFGDSPTPDYRLISLNNIRPLKQLNRIIDRHPFVPSDPADRDRHCLEIFEIQAAGVAKRMEHTGAKTAVIGVSGGLDSTLALLVTMDAFDKVGLAHNRIISVTLPGFATSHKTYSNAVKLCCALGTNFREININEACEQHFADIGHDVSTEDVTFENVQARERTQILMDLANKENGLVIGTGDLSEIALGWSTYNGDHMSMYAVNCGVPKTLIRYIVEWVAEHRDPELRKILNDILSTPISPELIPSKKGNDEIEQKTEERIGPYNLHDFFLYHQTKYGASPEKLKFLAGLAFLGDYSEDEIGEWLGVFIERFFSNQFKRNCIPDGPKVGSISLSPRGDWRMPSDASPGAWLGK